MVGLGGALLCSTSGADGDDDLCRVVFGNLSM